MAIPPGGRGDFSLSVSPLSLSDQHMHPIAKTSKKREEKKKIKERNVNRRHLINMAQQVSYHFGNQILASSGKL